MIGTYDLLLFRRVERSGQVSFAEVGQYDHDHLASVFRSLGYLDRSPSRRTAANSAEQTFLSRQITRHLHAVLITDLHHLVDDVNIQNIRNKAAPMP